MAGSVAGATKAPTVGRKKVGPDGRQIMSRPSGRKGIDQESVERELLWRSWFPKEPVLANNLENPPEIVEPLLEAFEKFCRDNVKIKVPGKGSVPLELRDAQRETVRGWLTHRYTIVLKARQIGFSTITAIFALWLVLGWADREIIMLSRRERDAVKLLGKARYAYRKLPEWVRDRGPVLLNRTTMSMQFDNDSVLESFPSANDPARGESAFAVFVDEWGMLPNQEDAWASIEPIADVGGRVIGLGTARGEGSFFHRLWQGSSHENGTNRFHGMFFPWWAVPDRDADWYEDKVANMEPWQRFQEYPSTAAEAFIGSGNPFYDLEVLRAMEIKNPSWTGDIGLDDNGRNPVFFDGNKLLVLEEPVEGAAYAIGADVAMGLDHGDFSVAWVLDVESGDPVAVWRGKCDPNDFGESVLPALGFWYNTALLCVEVNNHGLTTVQALMRLKYPRLYRRRTLLKRRESATETVGWMTTRTTKRKLCDALTPWLREHNVWHKQTVDELKTFVREQKGPENVLLHGSPHDDCVMGLALAVEALRYAVVNNYQAREPEFVPGTIAWWANKLDSDRRRGRSRGRLSPRA